MSSGTTMCHACARFRGFDPVSDWPRCEPYPSIPPAIYFGDWDHRMEFEGDGGLTFQQDPGKPPLEPRLPVMEALAEIALDRHYGPGKHKSGSDQDVHGGSVEDIKDEDEVEREQGRGRWFVDANVLAAVRQKARDKYHDAPEPTEADKQWAREMYERLGADRAEANMRGNVYDRRRSKARLLREFGDGTTCPCVYCGVVLTEETIERDRIYPGSEGGRYIHANLVPADGYCNKRRGDRAFADFDQGWPTFGESRSARAIPSAGTLCEGTEAVGPDADHEPRHLRGNIQTIRVPVLDFTQVVIDGYVVDPETIKIVEE